MLRKKNLFLIALLCTALFWGCTQTGNDSTTGGKMQVSTLEKIAKTKTLHVGYINFPPIVYKEVETGEIKGHFVLAVKEISKQIEVKCEYHEATWSTFTAGLQNGEFDLSIAPTFGTIPRAMAVAFTTPLMYLGNSAIVRKGETRFRSIKDVDQKGIVIAVTQGEAGHEYAEANIHNAKITVQSQADQTLAFTQVIAERADIALGDAWATSQFAKAHSDKVDDLFADNPYNLTAVCWAVRSNDIEFLLFINTAIEVLRSTGKLDEYEREYKTHWLHLERNYIVD